MMPCILREKRAQATAEMAVVAPVMIILALIVYNLMQFACAVARFDRVAPDIVLAQGVSPQGDATLGKTATVETALPNGVKISAKNYPITRKRKKLKSSTKNTSVSRYAWQKLSIHSPTTRQNSDVRPDLRLQFAT